jgi:hypothetical protein
MFALSATSVDSVSAEKLAALDAYYREVQLLKYRYNNLVGFLNSLSTKQLSAKEQQIFNEGIVQLQQMQAQMLSIKGIEITYTPQGAVIGFIPLLIIAAVLILAAVTGWTIVEIAAMREKTKQINDSYNLSMWVANKKQEIAQQVTSGQISPDAAKTVIATLDQAQANADKVAQAAAKDNSSGGIFGNIATIVKWGAIGFIAVKGLELIKSNKSK